MNRRPHEAALVRKPRARELRHRSRPGGIQDGDPMLAAAVQPVASTQALRRLMLTDAIGRQLRVTVARNGALVNLIATPVGLGAQT